jgi:hypothetical protein
LAERYPTTTENVETTEDIVGINANELEGYLDLMFDEKLLDGRRSKDGVENMHLTVAGRRHLYELRRNAWHKKLVRVILSWMDKAMTSIFLPILVSVLTVLMIRYLGLDSEWISPSPD